jgi:hypothetical protein
VSWNLENKEANESMTLKYSGEFSPRSVVWRSFVACMAVATLTASAAAAKVYTLVSDSPDFDDSPYGFSGTITTDGRIGFFLDASFITDWSITVETPGEVDGVKTQTLTPAGGSTVSLLGPRRLIAVTPTSISLPHSVEPFTFLDFSAVAPHGEFIRFQAPYSVALITATGSLPGFLGAPGEILVTDSSEVGSSNHRARYDVMLIATAIPEPSSLVLLAMLKVVGFSFHRRRLRNHCSNNLQCGISSHAIVTLQAGGDHFNLKTLTPKALTFRLASRSLSDVQRASGGADDATTAAKSHPTFATHFWRIHDFANTSAESK